MINNHGSIPATHIVIFPSMAAVAVKDGLDLEASLKKSLMDFNKIEEHLTENNFGRNLFPDKPSLAENHELIIPISEINFALQAGKVHDRAIISIGGCINYRFLGGKGQTTFNYALMEKNTNSMGINMSPRIIPIDKLYLLEEPFGIYAK